MAFTRPSHWVNRTAVPSVVVACAIAHGRGAVQRCTPLAHSQCTQPNNGANCRSGKHAVLVGPDTDEQVAVLGDDVDQGTG